MTDELNPYRPPTAELVDAASPGQAALAGKWRRFGTLVVDYVGYYAAGAVTGVAVVLLFGERALPTGQGGSFLLGVFIILAYYLLFEGLWGRTPGKFVFGTRVVDEAGNRPAFGAIVKRSLCRLIPFEAFSFFGERGLHDRLSKTRVVMAR